MIHKKAHAWYNIGWLRRIDSPELKHTNSLVRTIYEY